VSERVMLCCVQELSRVTTDLQLVQDDLDTVTVCFILSVYCCMHTHKRTSWFSSNFPVMSIWYGDGATVTPSRQTMVSSP